MNHDIGRKCQRNLLDHVLDNHIRREHHCRRCRIGVATNHVQQFRDRDLSTFRRLLCLAHEHVGVVVLRERLESQFAEANLRSKDIVVVVCKGAAHRTQFFESRMDELLFAEHVTFLFEPALLRHVNLQAKGLVRSRPLDNGNVHVVERLNKLAVLREPVRLIL